MLFLSLSLFLSDNWSDNWDGVDLLDEDMIHVPVGQSRKHEILSHNSAWHTI